jgi:hypothetical protein
MPETDADRGALGRCVVCGRPFGAAAGVEQAAEQLGL